MHIIVLIALVVALTVAGLEPLAADPWAILPAAVAYLAGTVALGALRTALSLRAMAFGGDGLHKSMRRHNLLTILTQAWLVGALAGLIAVGYGRWVLEDLSLQYVPLVGEAALMVPFVAALLASWLLEYPFYRLMRARIAQQQMPLAGPPIRIAWTLREYVGYNLRHGLLFVAAPVGLILLLRDSLWLLHWLFPRWVGEVAVMAGSLVCAGGVFLIAPALVVRVWRTERLPEGRLRDELAGLCRRLRLRCRQLLIWRTGGMIANAAVMGLIGRFRYVLLSDAVLEQLEGRQVKAIFAHEAGHAVHRHLPYAMLFALSTGVLCSTAGAAAAALLGLPDWAEGIAMLALLGAAWAFAFGWISRRFEWQSDAFGAWCSAGDGPDPTGRITPEGAAIFACALERVALLNGIPPHQRNWRHGSIAQRINYVLWLGGAGGGRGPIDRGVRRIKAGLWAALAASAACIALRLWLGF